MKWKVIVGVLLVFVALAQLLKIPGVLKEMDVTHFFEVVIGGIFFLALGIYLIYDGLKLKNRS